MDSMGPEQVLEYYRRKDVQGEISDFSRGRWVAVEGEGRGGRRLFLRYWDTRGARPLSIGSPEDLERVLMRFRWAKPRTFYASANLYLDLGEARALEEPGHLVGSTPTWDIDGPPEHFRDTLRVAEIILEELRALGITRSVYLLWSGRGAHVRVHEGAFSKHLTSTHNPLDAAYALVEYVLRRASVRLEGLLAQRPLLKVENLMDIKRVFTAPLSLHRELDLSAVCLKPDEIQDFDIAWANPESPRHNPAWRQYLEGEADEAARKALQAVPGYFAAAGLKRGVVEPPAPGRATAGGLRVGVGRFQVMALLQAARYYLLYRDEEKAKSFGLNRAIFYAWAKRTGGIPRRAAPAPGAPGRPRQAPENVVYVGDEMAFISGEGWFEIGGQVQRPADYQRQVVERIEKVLPYHEAWRRALDYVGKFDRQDLESQRAFYEKVYRPVRDSFLS